VNVTDDCVYSDDELLVFLLHLYPSNAEYHESSTSLWDVADTLEYARPDAQNIADALQGKGLLTYVSVSGHVALTSRGSFEVMLALAQPDKPSRYFPSVAQVRKQARFAPALRTVNFSELLGQLREFCVDLTLSDDMSDRLGTLVAELESVVGQESTANGHVVNELQVIDRLLANQVPA
jgi:hypothetical protein